MTKKRIGSLFLIALIAVILSMSADSHWLKSANANNHQIPEVQDAINLMPEQLYSTFQYQEGLVSQAVLQSLDLPTRTPPAPTRTPPAPTRTPPAPTRTPPTPTRTPPNNMQTACLESRYYFFFGNELQNSPNSSTTITQSPWKSVGVVHRNGNTDTGSSGVLIGSKYVLTAAHNIYDNQMRLVNSVSFSLAQHSLRCKPYGTISASKAWVPDCWINNTGGNRNSERTRACDFALLELTSEVSSLALQGAPSPARMSITNQSFENYRSLPAQANGYPSPNVQLPPDFSMPNRPPSTPYETTEIGRFLSIRNFGNDSTALIKAKIEGIAGMSGSPVWFTQNGIEQLAGILIGSPQENCELGENWVATITPSVRESLFSIMRGNNVRGMSQEAFALRARNESPNCTTFP